MWESGYTHKNKKIKWNKNSWFKPDRVGMGNI